MRYLVIEKMEHGSLKTCGRRFDSPITALHYVSTRRRKLIGQGYLAPYFRENRTMYITEPDTGEVIGTIQVKRVGV